MKENSMKTKIVLFDLINNGERIMEPLGMASITAVLRNRGFYTQLLSYNVKDIPYDKFVQFRPDILGISINQSTLYDVFSFCKWIKSVIPTITIVIGGYLGTYYGDEILKKCNNIDIIISGEGEYAFEEIAEAIENKDDFSNILGITYRKNSTIYKNNNREPTIDLDNLPFPSRDIMKQYNIHLAQIEGSRGCTSSCSFCSLHNFWTNNHKSNCPRWRAKSVNRVVDEIEKLNKEYGINRFTFLDCSFENPDNNYDRIMDMAEEIIKRDLKIYYYINTRSTFYKIADNYLMNQLIKSGLCGLFIGIESFYEPDLKIYGKMSSVSDNIKAVSLFLKYPINLDIGSIIFHPYTTIDGLRENHKHLSRFGYSKKVLYYSKLYAYKGTAIYNKIIKDGLMKESTLDTDNCMSPKYDFNDKKVKQLYDYISMYNSNLGVKVQTKLNYYANDHLDVLVYLKRAFDNTQGELLIENYTNEYNQLKNEFVIRNSNCFINLLNLVEHGWSVDEATSITNKWLNNTFLYEYINSLENNRIKLFLKLSKINSQIISSL